MQPHKFLWSKLSLVLLPLFLVCGLSQAQNTTSLTGTVIDPTSQAWINGYWQATIYNPSGGTPVYLDGTRVPPSFSGALDNTGAFQGGAEVGNNSKILPTGTAWRFTICPVASTPCSVLAPTSVTGTTTDISVYINAHISAIQINGSIGGTDPVTQNWAYQTSEIVNQINGSGVTLTSTANECYVWNSNTWVPYCSGGGGGGNPCTDTAQSVQYNNAGAFGCTPLAYDPGTGDFYVPDGGSFYAWASGEDGFQFCADPNGPGGRCGSGSGAIEFYSGADFDVYGETNLSLVAGISGAGDFKIENTNSELKIDQAGNETDDEIGYTLTTIGNAISINDTSPGGIVVEENDPTDGINLSAVNTGGGVSSINLGGTLGTYIQENSNNGITIQNLGSGTGDGISLSDNCATCDTGIVIQENSTVAILIENNGGDLNLETNDGDIELYTTGTGNVELEASGTGGVQIQTGSDSLATLNGSQICSFADPCPGLPSQALTLTGAGAVCHSGFTCTSLGGAIDMTLDIGGAATTATLSWSTPYTNPVSCMASNWLQAATISSWTPVSGGDTWSIVAQQTGGGTVTYGYTCTPQ